MITRRFEIYEVTDGWKKWSPTEASSEASDN